MPLGSMIRVDGKNYKIKPLEFLKGKMASYSNELGLEHVGNVYKNGKHYAIFDSGIGNIGNINACAVEMPANGKVNIHPFTREVTID